MTISIVQKDGSKTPVSEDLLRKLVACGKIPPDTLLVVDGKTCVTADLPELAEIYKRLGVIAVPAVAVPPRVGEEPAAPTPAPAPAPAAPTADKAVDPETAEIYAAALKNVSNKFEGAVVAGLFLTFAGFVGPFIVSATFRADINPESFAGWLHSAGITAFCFFLSALAVLLYWSVYWAIRSAALLREEAALRQERYLKKLASAVKVKTNK